MALTLPCLLLPLSAQNILLPSAAVAEILAYEKPKEVLDCPKWLIGILTWRGVHIPLAHLENMASHLEWNFSEEMTQLPENSKRCVAVLNRATQIPGDSQQDRSDRYPFFAIVLENSPKLKHLSEEELRITTQFTEKDKRFLMEIKAQDDSAFIPNIESLWEMIDALPARLQWFRQIIM